MDATVPHTAKSSGLKSGEWAGETSRGISSIFDFSNHAIVDLAEWFGALPTESSKADSAQFQILDNKKKGYVGEN